MSDGAKELADKIEGESWEVKVDLIDSAVKELVEKAEWLLDNYTSRSGAIAALHDLNNALAKWRTGEKT